MAASNCLIVLSLFTAYVIYGHLESRRHSDSLTALTTFLAVTTCLSWLVAWFAFRDKLVGLQALWLTIGLMITVWISYRRIRVVAGW